MAKDAHVGDTILFASDTDDAAAALVKRDFNLDMVREIAEQIHKRDGNPIGMTRKVREYLVNAGFIERISFVLVKERANIFAGNVEFQVDVRTPKERSKHDD